MLRELRSWDDVTVIDLPDQLAELNDPESSYFDEDGVHPNAAGHRAIADVIEEALRTRWGIHAQVLTRSGGQSTMLPGR